MSNEEDQDLVDYDEEEEEQNVAAEETADAEGKETKKWVNNCKKNTKCQCHATRRAYTLV